MSKKSTFVTIIALILGTTGCVLCTKYKKQNIEVGSATEVVTAMDSLVKTLTLLEGFEISIYADSVVNARSLAYSPIGVLYVSTRSEGNVYALVDSDRDGKVDAKYTILSKGNMPNGIAYKDGDLYVAEVNRILKYKNIDNNLPNPPKPEVIYDQYPTEKHHGWKYIAFGPDGKLYVPVGAPCNICEPKDSIYAAITRIDADGSNRTIVQHGVRNTVGFDWSPVDGSLWFTDNGRDMMGDDIPECELNHAPSDGMNFGFPYCHQGDVADPEFGAKFPCSDFTAPAAKLGAHTAPLGMMFYRGDQFPTSYHNQILIARHGSWNRTKKSGYDVVLATIGQNNKVTSVKPFITGWLDNSNDEVWGRPVAFAQLPDGSVLISDDYADVVYRVKYVGVKK